MSFLEKIDSAIKTTMLQRDKVKLDALRSIKAALLLLKTEKGATGNITEEAAVKALQRIVKQRKEAAEIYTANARIDLAEKELAELAVIEQYLPKQINTEELQQILLRIISDVKAQTPADVGKVMAVAMKELAGKTDGKTVSSLANRLLQK